MVETISSRIRFYESVFGRVDLAHDEKNAAVKCPLCGKESSDKKKFIIRLADDVTHCWVCGFGSRSLIAILKKIAPNRLDEYIKDFYRGPKCSIENSDTVQEQIKLPQDFKLLATSLRDPDVRCAYNHLFKRGLSESDVWLYKLGLSNEHKWQRRIIFPSFASDGSLNYFTGRALDSWKSRYDAPAVDKLPIIFNELFIDWSQELVLCEGPFDTVKCGDNVTALLGSELSEESYLFEQIVYNKTPIALALDADMRYTKTLKIAKKLQSYSIPVRIVEVQTDPGDMTREEFTEALSLAQAPRWSSMFTTRLKNAAVTTLSI